MARHAGFAAVLSIGHPAMQRLLSTLYAANRLPHVLTIAETLPWSGGTLNVNGSLFCGVPQLGFLASSNGLFSVDLRCWGSLRFQFPQEFWEGPFEITATALVAPQLALQPTVVQDGPNGDLIDVIALSLGLDATTAQVSTVTIRPLRGQPSPDVQTIIDSPALPALLTSSVQKLVAEQATASIPLRFLGGLQMSPAMTARFRIVDSAFLVGIDVAWPTVITSGIVSVYASPPVASNGDLTALADFRDGHDIAFAVHPAQIPTYFAQALAQLRSQLPEGVEITQLDISARQGFLRVAGTASVQASGIQLATARVRFDLIPVLTDEPLFTWLEKVSARIEHVHIDVSLSALVTAADVLAGVLTLGVASLGVAEIVDAIRGGLAREIVSEGVDTSAGGSSDRNQQITLTGTTKPLIDVRIQTVGVDPDGLLSTTSVRPRLGRPRISGASRIFVSSGVRVQIHYACTFPLDLLPSDPELRVSWTLRRLDRNITVDAKDNLADDDRSYRADLTLTDATVPPAMSLACRIYRTMGAASDNLFNRTVTLKPTDRLRHDHPYVHWAGVVPLPAFIKRTDGSLRRNGLASVDRTSKIHRTDLPARCLFADAFGPVITPEGPDYFDELPFPKNLITFHREKVCDYCFFGGPDKTSPLP